MAVFKEYITIIKKKPIWEILFYTLAIIIIIIIINNFNKSNIENFEDSNKKFITKNNENLYDDFYVDYYDQLVFSKVKNDYEIGTIISNAKLNKQSKILDIGSGTGHHVKSLNAHGYNVIGIDKSKAMIQKAKNIYPDQKYKIGNALDSMLFMDNNFTHILCLYFTIYYMKDKKLFFNNCYKWLMPGGYLVIHLVNRDKFNPILPAGDPLFMVSPQKYSKKRITNTIVKFNNNNTYKSNFNYLPKENLGIMKETFNNQKTIRQQEHKLYMPSQKEVLNHAKDIGFILLSQTNMNKVQYDDQFLYVLYKPN